jgi:predicted nuclease of predicted toxin-antitoxin system
VKFLADMGVSMTTMGALRGAGEEAVHLREEGLMTLPDDQILEKALKEQRVILTFDLDFGELLAAGGGRAPSVVLFRMRNQTPAAVTPRLFRVLETCRSALETGAIVIVEDEGFRVRPLPIRQS